MWVFLSNAFLSIVAHRAKPGVLMVRARARGDLEAVFPGCDAQLTPSADYRYRAEVGVDQVAVALDRQVRLIGYDNFKNSVVDDARHDAYLRVWSAMAAYQVDAAKKERRPRKAGRRRPVG